MIGLKLNSSALFDQDLLLLFKILLVIGWHYGLNENPVPHESQEVATSLVDTIIGIRAKWARHTLSSNANVQ
jgi:hypothetical protein